jgi:hypothetical protein
MLGCSLVSWHMLYTEETSSGSTCQFLQPEAPLVVILVASFRVPILAI